MIDVKRVVFMLDGCVHCEPLSSAWDHLPRYVLASDYDRLERECERLRLDNLSKNGSIKAFGAQVAALQRAVKNRDKLKDRAEAERDALRAQVGAMREALAEAKYRIEQGRVWAGTKYQLTGLHPHGQQKALDVINAALQAKP